MIELTEDHKYFLDGTPVPGFSEIAQATGLIKPYLGDPWYGERGSAVHAATVLIDSGELDWNSVDPQIEGFLAGYLKFKQSGEVPWEHAEHRLYHPTYRFCGTPDRFLPLFDIKTGQSDPIQLEAYAELLRANGYDPGRFGFMLHLKEDGTYKLGTHKYDRKLLGVFLSATSVWWYRKGKGLL